MSSPISSYFERSRAPHRQHLPAKQHLLLKRENVVRPGIWLVACGLLLAGTSFGASPAWLTAHDNEVHALVARMTLEEKRAR